MINKYGNPPYTAAVIHGGPGDLGSMSSVAKELSKNAGILEPIQSKYSVTELIEELKEQLNGSADRPLNLIGHSWGAWLSMLFAAKYPNFVKQLIIIGSGPLEESYAESINTARKKRLSKKETAEFDKLLSNLAKKSFKNKDKTISALGNLIEKTDNFDISDFKDKNTLKTDGNMYAKVWKEAQEMRSNGSLLAEIKKIKCPVHIIHGFYDPHPVEGLTVPLKKFGIPFELYILPKCGHSPFKEKYAAEAFYALVDKILENSIK